jgi:hypothetical protein
MSSSWPSYRFHGHRFNRAPVKSATINYDRKLHAQRSRTGVSYLSQQYFSSLWKRKVIARVAVECHCSLRQPIALRDAHMWRHSCAILRSRIGTPATGSFLSSCYLFEQQIYRSKNMSERQLGIQKGSCSKFGSAVGPLLPQDSIDKLCGMWQSIQVQSGTRNISKGLE